MVCKRIELSYQIHIALLNSYNWLKFTLFIPFSNVDEILFNEGSYLTFKSIIH